MFDVSSTASLLFLLRQLVRDERTGKNLERRPFVAGAGLDGSADGHPAAEVLLESGRGVSGLAETKVGRS